MMSGFDVMRPLVKVEKLYCLCVIEMQVLKTAVGDQVQTDPSLLVQLEKSSVPKWTVLLHEDERF